MKRDELACIIDHTDLRPTASAADIRRLCAEAKEFGFAAVCVQPYYVPLAAAELQGTTIKVATVIGFPLGMTTSTVKATEAREAVANGATELDMVINLGALKDGRNSEVAADISAVVEAAGVPVKVILETCYLNEAEIVRACHLAVEAGAAFVKTSTGFGPAGAKPEHVQLMRSIVGPDVGVKAAGGIRTYRDALTMVEAGANRLGTSHGVKVITEAPTD